ncbi:MAG: Phosphate import ATP-binding protein PstB, partial [Planctomycetota bacterium]
MTDSGSSPSNPVHAPAPAAKPAGVREIDRSASRDLAAIARGEAVDAVVHEEVLAEDPVVEIDDFCLFYGGYQALHGVSIKIPRGKITALIGPSGCGKTTLLRSVNRLNDLIDGVRTTGDMRL